MAFFHIFAITLRYFILVEFTVCLGRYNASYLRLVNDGSVINIKINMTLIVGVR